MDTVIIATLATAAIGVAFSPVVLIEMILIIFSERRVVNALVFVSALTLQAAGVLAVGAWTGEVAQSGGSPIGSVVSIILALVLIAVGVFNFLRRHDTSPPKLLGTIAGMGAGATLMLAFGAIVLNPKNLPLLLSAGAALPDSGWPVLAGAIVVLVATAPYLAITLYAVLGGERATRQLDGLHSWLLRHNRMIMTILCTGLGGLMLLKSAFGG